jgi:hypothetical protein
MMEAAGTSETSVNVYQTTRRNNPKAVMFVISYYRSLFFKAVVVKTRENFVQQQVRIILLSVLFHVH